VISSTTSSSAIYQIFNISLCPRRHPISLLQLCELRLQASDIHRLDNHHYHSQQQKQLLPLLQQWVPQAE
jgi:hypothetical protein